MINVYDFLVNSIENPFIRFIIKMKTGREKFNTLKNHVIPLMKDRLPGLKNGTEDTITRNAPAMILFHANKNAENYKEDIYFTIIRKKTASLIASCCACGAASAGSEPATIEKMRLFGEYTGIAFQIKDDLFDYEFLNLTGKPNGTDIKDRKMTLPLIFTLNNTSLTEKRTIIKTITAMQAKCLNLSIKSTKQEESVIQKIRCWSTGKKRFKS